MSTVNKTWLESRPKGTVIQVIDLEGHHFELVAEGGAFRDFILHKGDVPSGLEGRTSRSRRYRQFWPTERLARWVSQGLCTIEPARGASQ